MPYTRSPALLPVWSANLGRCCHATIHSHRGEEKEGLTVDCEQCRRPLRVFHGAWESAIPTVQADDPSNHRITYVPRPDPYDAA